jgi:hypothetical protein
MNGYQKLKDKHRKEKAEMMEDIVILIDPNHPRYSMVAAKWKLRLMIERLFWFGDSNVLLDLHTKCQDAHAGLIDSTYIWDVPK